MPYYLRMMRRGDIPQIAEIDREVFPTQWPPPNYRRELENRLAHYIVVCNGNRKAEELNPEAVPKKRHLGFMARLRRLLSDHLPGSQAPPTSKDFIAGFAGMWIMADEAHVTNVAVRENYRQRGLGELLVLSLIDLAIELKAEFVTLEVRTSNMPAQSLYRKYGFNKVGVRRGYYIDNGEDAVLMTTEKVTTAAFRGNFERLKQAHSKRWGIPLSKVSESIAG